MTIPRMLVLASLSRRRLAVVLHHLSVERRTGRPWSRSLRHRILIACVALRTSLTIGELAVVFGISKSAAHRILATITPRLSELARRLACHDRRWSWMVDGTLIPTRDHSTAAKSRTIGTRAAHRS